MTTQTATPLKIIQRQRGFVLTLELILITTILIIGCFAGVAAVRDALVKHRVNQQNRDIVVVDGDNKPLGPIIALDEHEAPIVPYIDRGVAPLAPDPAHRNYRALVGVRDDRFTSREPVYYDGPNCTGNPCIKVISDEASDSSGVDRIVNTGAVSYLHALQGGPGYAIGRSPDGIIGHLYRTSAEACPVEAAELKSRYMSQKVITGSPCESFELFKVEADSSCLVGVETGGLGLPLIGPILDPVLDGGLGQTEGNILCEQCPAGFESQGDILDNYLPIVEPLLDTVLSTLSLTGLIPQVNVTLGDVCCPTGTRLSEDEGLVETLVFTALEKVFDLLGLDLLSNPLVIDVLATLGIEEGVLHCIADVTMQKAEPVTDSEFPEQNALERFIPPFQVTLPYAGAADADRWFYIPPDGEADNAGL